MVRVIDWLKTGEALKSEMNRKNMSVKSLSEKTGFSERTIKNYVNGKSKIATDRLLSISNCLEVPVGDIVVCDETALKNLKQYASEIKRIKS